MKKNRYTSKKIVESLFNAGGTLTQVTMKDYGLQKLDALKSCKSDKERLAVIDKIYQDGYEDGANSI